jgi:hypothetical protein
MLSSRDIENISSLTFILSKIQQELIIEEEEIFKQAGLSRATLKILFRIFP